MPQPLAFPLIAVDVGNNRTKFGWFDGESGDRLPKPTESLQIDDRAPGLERLARWFEDRREEPSSWWIGSVNRPACTRLVDWLQEHRPDDRATLLAAGDLPLKVALERPDMVGIDRLLDAVAANQLREPSRPAVVVDVGSAITVDLLSSGGAFLGGAILPGIAMSARALDEFTDLLPRIEMAELTVAPPALGKSTVPAMRSGLFWGAVGAIRQLTELLAGNASDQPQIFLTGGTGPAVAQLLGQRAQHVPHLTLAGIVLAAQSAR